MCLPIESKIDLIYGYRHNIIYLVKMGVSVQNEFGITMTHKVLADLYIYA